MILHNDLSVFSCLFIRFTALLTALEKEKKGTHIEGMAEDEIDPLVSTQIGQPVPGGDAFVANHQAIAHV